MTLTNDIANWRARVFAMLLSIVIPVGAVSTLSIAPFLIHHGMWKAAAADSLALMWTIGIWRLEKLSYETRVLHFLAIVYFLAIALSLSVGVVSLSYLLGPPVIASILLTLRTAILATILGAVSLIAMGCSGFLVLDVPDLHDPLKAALVAALNYTTVAVMLSLTCSKLLQGLSSTLADMRLSAATLQASKNSLRKLNHELELTTAAVARLNDLVIITKAAEKTDTNLSIIFVNDAFLKRTGYGRDIILGRSMRVLQGAETDPATTKKIADALSQSISCKAELTINAQNGNTFWAEIEMVPFARTGEPISHWVIVGRDITERRSAAAAIHRSAYYDLLTGLPNRRLLMDRLEALKAKTTSGCEVGAVLYLDLDNFKNVNDSRGHGAGDVLLEHTAVRLRECVRPCDVVARIGGDEFVVLLNELGPNPASAAKHSLKMAEMIREALTTPLDLDDQHYTITASMGLTLVTGSETSSLDLLREADTAMYRAKTGGRDGIVLFESSMLTEKQDQLMLENDLESALASGELAMHLQLQVDTAGRPTGAELLIRWYRADGKMIPPDVFIPVAEASGLIVPIGYWVLREACVAWLALEEAGYTLPLSINVSPLQFRQSDFVDRVQAILLETGAPAHQLIFEVTEGLLMDDIDQTIGRMHELVGLGIRFSIDDFGTGYSNLAYLSKMPLYELKIDKSFMQATPHEVGGTAIVQSIISMASHLGLRVVAEGIETHAQADYLTHHGSPHMQGYFYHRPMPLNQLIVRLATLRL